MKKDIMFCSAEIRSAFATELSTCQQPAKNFHSESREEFPIDSRLRVLQKTVS